MIDYTSSGVRQTWEFVLCDSRTLEELEALNGVTGFELAESWRGDFRQTGTIDLDGTALPNWAAVRVYLVSQQSDELERTELCTLLPAPADVKTIYGRGVASVPLRSMMAKLDSNLNPADVGVSAGQSVQAHFEQVCSDSGAVPWTHPGIEAAAPLTSSARVWSAGESYLTEAHAMANACNGRIEPDAHGRVCLVPYQNPANVAESFEIPTGAASITLPGFTQQGATIVNRVIASYSRNDEKWFSVATVDVSHPWHFGRIGRWEVLEVNPPEIPEGANVQAVLDKLTAQTLKAHSDTRATYSLQMAYMPVRVGQVGTVYYKDSPAMEPIEVLGFVSQRSIKKDGGGVLMELTIEEV